MINNVEHQQEVDWDARALESAITSESDYNDQQAEGV